MKRQARKQIGLLLLACLIATPAAARKAKPESVAALARALVAKLPSGQGEAIYTAPPSWIGKDRNKEKTHYLFCKAIGDELARAVSAAAPADRVVTPADAAGILSKVGFEPLDISLATAGRRPAAYAADLIGARMAIISEVRQEKDGILLTVEAIGAQRGKRHAKLKALLPVSPEFRALLSQPDVPIKDSAGVYAAGIGGVGEPRCVHCPNPPFPPQAVQSRSTGTLLVGLTVGTNGRVTNDVLLTRPTGRGFGQAALEAIRSWQFRPARGPHGTLVPVHLIAQIQFSLLP